MADPLLTAPAPAPAERPSSRRVSLALAILVAPAVLALLPRAAVAQTVAGDTGVIEGRVRDDAGAPLAGAHVAIRGPGAGIGFELTARPDGSFGAVGLPAGVYSVEVWLEGYASAIAEGVDLDSGEALRLDFDLAAGRAIAITVTSSPRIDVSTPGRFTRVPVDLLEALPDRFRFADLARLTAALTELPLPSRGVDAATDGGETIDLRGRSLGSGRVLVDGLEIDPRDAPPLQLDAALVNDRALEVSGGGLAPAFGGAPGGVIRLVTRRRAEEERPGWHGAVDLAVQADPLSESGREGASLGGSPAGLDAEDRGDLAVAFGGAAFGERLNLFVAAAERRAEVAQELAGGGGPRQELDGNAAAVRLSATPARRLGLNLSGRRAHTDVEGLLADAERLPPNAIERSPSGRRQSEQATLAIDFGAGGRLHLHGWIGRLDALRRDPVDAGDRSLFLTPAAGVELPPELDREAGFATGLPGLGGLLERESRMVRAQATWLQQGGHRFALGLERKREEVRLDRGIRGAQTEVLWNAAALAAVRGELGARLDSSAALAGVVEREREALFVEDQWRLARDWTLRLGLRAESDRASASGAAGLDAFDLGLGDRLEPRLGVAWDVLGDGNYVIYLTAERTHLPLDDRWAVAAAGSVALLRTAAPVEAPGELGAQPADAVRWLQVDGLDVDPALEAERWHELALGSEQLVVPGLRIRAEATFRELERGVATVFVDPDGDGLARATLVNPGRGLGRFPYGASAPEHPGAVFRRLALELAADVRLGGRWTAGGAYTYAESEGSYDGTTAPFELASSLAPGRLSSDSTSLLPAPVCAWLEACFAADGSSGAVRDAADRRHRWKVYGSWDLPRGLQVGGFFQYLSGAPWTPRVGAVRADGEELVGVGSVAAPNAGGVRVGDAISQLDFELRWHVEAGPFDAEGRRLAFYLVASNVLDQRRALSRWDRLTLAPVVVEREALFAGFDPLALAEQQGVPLDPRFGQARQVQRPREVRFGLRFGF